MSEEKKSSFWVPNALYKLKINIGVVSVTIGFIIAVGVSFLVLGGFLLNFFDDEGEVLNLTLQYLGTWKIDIGLAILLGSTIISGAILWIFRSDHASHFGQTVPV